ncbi:MAG: hypothetical protein L0K86_23565 [Actinomycetia bacterium]|nr:hypothetical protein [Actinomycetes bacterium]
MTEVALILLAMVEEAARAQEPRAGLSELRRQRPGWRPTSPPSTGKRVRRASADGQNATAMRR